MRRIRKIEYDAARKVYQPARNEEDAVEEIVNLLTWNRVQVWRSLERIPLRNRRGTITGRFQTPGLPDLTGFVLRGDEVKIALPFWIEVKGPHGQLRPAQRQFIEAYQAAGLFAFMARSWADVKLAFQQHGVTFKVG